MKSLSIIIPAYNEEQRIGGTLNALVPFLKDRQQEGREVELIIVDNRSTDRTSAIALHALEGVPFQTSVIKEQNAGKGFAVQRGVFAAKHEIIAFMDADLMVPLDQIDRVLAEMDAGALIAVASRYAHGSTTEIPPPPSRKILSLLSQGAIRLALRIPIKDTQCGLKAFDRDIAPYLFGDLTSGGWGFDVEILSRAADRGIMIVEVPVRWSYQPGSHMSFRGAAKSGRDLLKLVSRRRQNRRSIIARSASPQTPLQEIQ